VHHLLRAKILVPDLFESYAINPPQLAAITRHPQSDVRRSCMRRFKDAPCALLVATDVVGRGIDVIGITH